MQERTLIPRDGRKQRRPPFRATTQDRINPSAFREQENEIASEKVVTCAEGSLERMASCRLTLDNLAGESEMSGMVVPQAEFTGHDALVQVRAEVYVVC
jgi:hypothetical protein